MFPPVFSRNSIVTEEVKEGVNPFVRAYRDAVVYDEREADDPLYEGPIVVHANGWIELEGDRLLSPSAVHHIDVYDERAGGDDEPGDDRDGYDDGGDDHRTNRFSPR